MIYAYFDEVANYSSYSKVGGSLKSDLKSVAAQFLQAGCPSHRPTNNV